MDMTRRDIKKLAGDPNRVITVQRMFPGDWVAQKVALDLAWDRIERRQMINKILAVIGLIGLFMAAVWAVVVFLEALGLQFFAN